MPKARDSLRLIQQALRLSVHVIRTDVSQLPSQLVGRLNQCDEPLVEAFLSRLDRGVRSAWLRPRTASLSQPGGNLLSLWRAYDAAPVCRLRVSDDETAVAVIDRDRIRYWSLETMTLLSDAEGRDACSDLDCARWQEDLPARSYRETSGNWSDHFDHVWEVATPPGRVQARSTIRVSTNPLRTNPQRQHSLTLRRDEKERSLADRMCTALALSDDGRFLCTGCPFGRVTVWTLDDQPQPLLSESVCDDPIVAVAPYRGDRRVVFMTDTGMVGVAALGLPSDRRPKRRAFLGEVEVDALFLSPSGDFAVVGTDQDELVRVNTCTGETSALPTGGFSGTFMHRKFSVSSDFRFAVIEGCGDDFYDGPYVGICDLNTGRCIFSEESSASRHDRWQVTYLRVGEQAWLVADVRGGELEHRVVDVRSGSLIDAIPPTSATKVRWLGDRSFSASWDTRAEARGLLCEVRGKARPGDSHTSSGASLAVTIPRGPRLVFTPDSDVTKVAISADGSSVAAACRWGQLHFLDIVGFTPGV